MHTNPDADARQGLDADVQSLRAIVEQKRRELGIAEPKVAAPPAPSSADVKQEYVRDGVSSESDESHEMQRNTTSGDSAADVVPDHGNNQERAKAFKELLDCPLPDLIVRAYEWNRKQEVAEAGIDEDGRFKSPMYWFVWLIRGHKDMQPLLSKGKQAMSIVEQQVARWSAHYKKKGASPPNGFQRNDPWQEWFGLSRADAAAEFLDVWSKARFLPGQTPLDQAADAARRQRFALRQEVMEKRPIGAPTATDDYGFFINLAGQLQVVVGNAPIKLPCEDVGELMKVSPMTISRYRKWAQEDGYLTLTKAHRFRSKGGGDATEFRFDTDRFDSLKERAQR